MLLLDNPVQAYPWGRRDGVAAVLGLPPSGGPEAELWVGAHDRAPSVVAAGPEAGRSLRSVLADRGIELPFLLKVLCIAQPLSLQAHPSGRQAAAGFAREDAAGIPIDADERTYRDPNPKPEALVAIEPTSALCGFRPPAEARRLVASADRAVLAPLLERLAEPDERDALRRALSWVLHLEGGERRAVAAELADAARALGGDLPGSPWAWVAELAAGHPGDPGCVAPLLLEVVDLRPGEAVHLPAGNLHAYLHGTGVEIMAASDNVLRGGLTPKHVDVEELLAVLRFEPGVPVPPVEDRRGALTVYDAEEQAFGLVRIDPTGAATTIGVTDHSLLLPMGADALVRDDQGSELLVGPGQAAYVPPARSVEVACTAPVWWATTGAGLPKA